MKIISMLKMIGFIGTILSSIPLFIFYISGQPPKNFLLVHLHVWLGAMFIVFAITNMVIKKRAEKQKS